MIPVVDESRSGGMGKKKKKAFGEIGKKKQRQYERVARLQYGPGAVNESVRRWNDYSDVQRTTIRDEGNEIYDDLVRALKAGLPPQSAETQAILARWHQHLCYFYEPTLEILRGLGQLYNTDPDFMATFQRLHRDLPPYLEEAITHYVDQLETQGPDRRVAGNSELWMSFS